MVDADVAELRLRRDDFGLAGLEIPREVRRECGGDLHADTVACAKNVASEQSIEIEEIDFPRS